MNPLLLGPIFEIGKTLLDRFVPDPAKKAEAEMELVRMAADGELKQVIAQLDTPVEWGGDWETFKDGPHLQLPWKGYP